MEKLLTNPAFFFNKCFFKKKFLFFLYIYSKYIFYNNYILQQLHNKSIYHARAREIIICATLHLKMRQLQRFTRNFKFQNLSLKFFPRPKIALNQLSINNKNVDNVQRCYICATLILIIRHISVVSPLSRIFSKNGYLYNILSFKYISVDNTVNKHICATVFLIIRYISVESPFKRLFFGLNTHMCNTSADYQRQKRCVTA
jgi:hypothetical protein